MVHAGDQFDDVRGCRRLRRISKPRQSGKFAFRARRQETIEAGERFCFLSRNLATIKGFEVMRMFRKGQFKLWIEAVGGGTEASFVNRLFGIYA